MTTHEYTAGPTPPPGAAPAGTGPEPSGPESSGRPSGPESSGPEPSGPVEPYGPEPSGRAGASVTPEAPVPAAVSAPAEAAGAGKPGRDRYLDLLRSIALVRVIVYHLFGWAWLSVLFPSMGVMFALAGSLMARSLSRPAWSVIRGRVRRLLPPLWAFGAVVLVLMFSGGWNPARDPDTGGGVWGVADVLNYLLPVGAPPYPAHLGSGSGLLDPTWAEQAAGPLWYLRAYLWFVVASPLLLRAFRRVPWATLLAPLALTAVVGTGLVTLPGETGNAVTDFAVYGGCWVLGFAHHDGMLAKVPRYLAISGSTAVMAFALWWASGHLGPEGWDLNDIPLADALWSFGFVVILLQYSPSWRELPGRLARWDKAVTLSNNRAVTIYLWHNMLIMATFPIVDRMYDLPFMDGDGATAALDATYTLWTFVLVWPLTALAVLAFGWIEDLAAKRAPRLWPDGPARGTPRGGHRSPSRAPSRSGHRA
ncbi:acyltransferase [Streptomyces sp. NPDC048489]|uniref:acyltransferase family protein n=1 Tax=Streptomyces sp. NPDC048489 TaxID=3154504 RepID=UPI0034177619